MNYVSDKIPLFVTVAVALAFLCIAVGARAQDATSTSYTLKNPSVGVQGGIATSTSFITAGSGDTFVSPAATSTLFSGSGGGPLGGESLASFAGENWRWYDDETSETPLLPRAVENTAPSGIWDDAPVKLRLTIKETADSGSVVKFRLQYSQTADFSGPTFDVAEVGDCTATSTWCYSDGVDTDNATITTNVLSDSDSCAVSVGDGCGVHNESGTTTTDFIHKAGALTEYEFTLTSSGAAMNTVYFFRVFETVNAQFVRLDSGKSYPSLTTAGAELTFTIAGLPAGTSTEGIVTDAVTTATSVSLGALPIGSDKKVAQRLTVVTNAKAGYQIQMFGRQGLLNAYGDEIAPVTGTNSVPSGWSTGCDSGAASCFGYHAGDDSLFSGSNRFAPNDSYAALDTGASEVAFSSARALTDIVDVVFRALARSIQPAGTYESSVVYIVTPVF